MIESALSWLGDLARFLGSFFPRLLIVQSSHRYVKYVHGARVVVLNPGLHIYWPLVTAVEWCAVVRSGLDLPTQVLETADGQTVAASGVIEFEVEDPVKFLAECENGYVTARIVASAALRRVILDNTRAELRADSELVDTLLYDEIQEALEPYGLHVLRAGLKDLAPVRALHLTGMPPGNGGHAGEVAFLET